MCWARNSTQPFLNSDHEQVINLSQGNFIVLALTLIDHMGEAPKMQGCSVEAVAPLSEDPGRRIMLTGGGAWSEVSDPTVGGHIEIPVRLDYAFISSQFLPFSWCYCPGVFICFKGNIYWMGTIRIKLTLSELLLAYLKTVPHLVFPGI